MTEVTKIGNTTGVDFVGDVVSFRDLPTHRQLLVLNATEMEALIAWYTEGLCPLCFDEIASSDRICERCLNEL